MPDQRVHVEGVRSIPMNDLSDTELVRLLIAGNADAMEVIFDRYYRIVMSVALRVVRDSGEAQDVVQIVFTEFYCKAALFDATKGNLKTWLLQYAYGRSINRKRSLKSRSFYNLTQLEAVDAVAGSNRTKLFDLESPEAKRLVEQVLAMLPDKQRHVIELVCFQGMTLAETAALSGDSLGNVQHAYYRGIEKLRSFLKKSSVQPRAPKEPRGRLSLFRKLVTAAEKTNDGEVRIVRTRAL